MKRMYKFNTFMASKMLLISQRNIVASLYPKFKITERNFTNFMLNKMKSHPENIAMIDGITGTKISYSDLGRRIHSVASALTTRGLKKGDKVGILAKNSVDYLSVYMATIGCGATVVAYNPSYSKFELEPLMSMTQPKFLFSNAGPLTDILPAMSTSYLKTLVTMDSETVPGTSSMSSLLEEGESHSPINDESYKSADDTSLIIFSSGTTGQPKGVPITNSNLIATSKMLELSYAASDNSVLLGVLPMFHIYGVMISFILTIASNSACVILPSFNPITFLQSIEQYKITHMHIVPPIALFLLNSPEVSKFNLSSISRITSGAAPLGKEIEEQINNLFLSYNKNFVLTQGYGLSETDGLVSIRGHCQEISRKKAGSVGRLCSNQEMKIISIETGEEVGPNEVGELLLRGDNIIKGYYKMDDEMNATYFLDGWLRTGDFGYYDDDQYIFLSDRIKELIKVKGNQVAPAELERLLLTHPCISDCAVIGVPHHEFGEVPRAFVVKRKEITETEIYAYFEKNLSEHKQLKGGVKFVDSIPKSASGKILRKILKGE